MEKILVTSALPYANGPIHIGHLVEYIQTDIWVRYWRLRKRNVIYICADDTHGTPIMLRARDEGIEPEELIQHIWHEHRRDFAGFQIQFDNYSSTNSRNNQSLCSEIYLALRNNGHIVERMIEQAYCESCNIFLPDRYIRGACPNCGAQDQYGDSCEVCSTTYSPRDLVRPYCVQCGAVPVWRESKHLFFKLSNFTDKLKKWLQEGHVQTEVANKLREWFEIGLNDCLVNKIANIPSRVLAILHKYCNGELATVDKTGRALIAKLLAQRGVIEQYYEERELNRVTLVLIQMAGLINEYLQEQKPWTLVREDLNRAATVCTVAVNGFKILATFIQPILPEISQQFAWILNMPTLTWDDLDQLVELKAVRQYEHLVKRVDRANVDAMMADSRTLLADAENLKVPQFTLDPLVDCDLRTMRVAELNPVPGSDLLVALKLEYEGTLRHVLAGVGGTAAADHLLGNDVLVVVNVEPRKLLGHTSDGMILAAPGVAGPTPIVPSERQKQGILD